MFHHRSQTYVVYILLSLVLLYYKSGDAFRSGIPLYVSSYTNTRQQICQLDGVVNKGPSIFFEDSNELPEEIDDEDEFLKYYPNEPTWSKMFPKGKTKPEMIRTAPDFENLKPDDPLFLDMPWPNEKGPEASAYGRHMHWKRGLSDTERLSWQKWAVYQRVMTKDKFEYSLEDYVYQNMIKGCHKRALDAHEAGEKLKSDLWLAIATSSAEEEKPEISAVIGALYSAFNRCNFNELRTLWLPDESVELNLPGFHVAKGHANVEALYREVVREAKPFGSVTHKVLNVLMVGYISIVYVLETVEVGTSLKSVKSKPRGGSDISSAETKSTSKVAPKRLLSVLVLRKWNKQWRIMKQQSSRFRHSKLAGDSPRPVVSLRQPDESTIRQIERTLTYNSADSILPSQRIDIEEEYRLSSEASVTDKSRKEKEFEKGLLPPLPESVKDALQDGKTLSVASRVSKNGEWIIGNDNPENSASNVEFKDSKNFKSVLKSTDMSEDAGVIKLNNDGSFFISRGDQKSARESIDRKSLSRNKAASTSSDKLTKATTLRSSFRGKNDYSSLSGDIDSQSLSLGRLTVKALRTLHKVGLITKEQKALLLSEMIENVDYEVGQSKVEVAFDLLVLRGVARDEDLIGLENLDISDLDEFAEHCVMMCRKFKSNITKNKAISYLDAEDEVDENELGVEDMQDDDDELLSDEDYIDN